MRLVRRPELALFESGGERGPLLIVPFPELDPKALAPKPLGAKY
jgi:hypothetical protein